MNTDLIDAIDALLAFIEERRTDTSGKLWQVIPAAMMPKFKELDQRVYALAFKAGLDRALPTQPELDRQLTAPGMPLVQFEGKTNLPGDWIHDAFHLLPEAGRWREAMSALRILAASSVANPAPEKPDVEDGDKYLPPESTEDAAGRFGWHRTTLMRYIESGEINCIRIKKRIRLLRDDVIRLGGKLE